MDVESRLKTALDESRLLILGAQVLFGRMPSGNRTRRNASIKGTAGSGQAM